MKGEIYNKVIVQIKTSKTCKANMYAGRKNKIPWKVLIKTQIGQLLSLCFKLPEWE